MRMIQVQAFRQLSGIVLTFSGPGEDVSGSWSRVDCGIAPYPFRQSPVIAFDEGMQVVRGGRNDLRVRLVTRAEFHPELRLLIPEKGNSTSGES